MLRIAGTNAHHFQQPRDPLVEYKALMFAAENNLLLPSSKVTELAGIKSHRQPFQRDSFTFTRTGKIGGQSAWRVERVGSKLKTEVNDAVTQVARSGNLEQADRVRQHQTLMPFITYLWKFQLLHLLLTNYS